MDDKATRVSLLGRLCRPRPRRAKKLRGGVFGFESRRACGVQRHRVVPRRQADASTSEDPGKIGNGVQRGEAGQPPIAEQSNFRVEVLTTVKQPLPNRGVFTDRLELVALRTVSRWHKVLKQ